ncbi:MAG: UDP-glucose dehydrogenase family protein [Leptospirillum sp.]|jgi:UDPglucose 6-dehydrogenase
MNICVVGSGYVGLVTATCFAEMGHSVIGVDVDAAKVERLSRGESPLYEPGLSELLHRNIKAGRLSFTTDLPLAVSKSLFVFVAVGTPMGADGSADLKSVLSVARSVALSMTAYRVVVVKSTVPVGTCRLVAEEISGVLAGRKLETPIPFDVVSNPEFLKEGSAVNDFMRPDRVVVGVSNPEVSEVMRELYAPFLRNGHPVIMMDVLSSELTKYASNSFLAMKISFMNKVAQICDKVGADVMNVRKGMGSDPRIGLPFLYAGVGYGGSCFPKDVQAFVQTGASMGVDMSLLEEVEKVNEQQKNWAIQKIAESYPDQAAVKVAIWGGAFKPETDDIRDAPSISVISDLLARKVVVSLYDPEAMSGLRALFPSGVQYCENPYDVLKDADILLLLTEWREFRNPDWDQVKSLMKGNLVLDGRNQYEASDLAVHGLSCVGVGRGCITGQP